MNKLNSLEDSFLDKNDRNEENNESNKIEKILCNHCGRTISNGIRCQGICVSDNEY
tara:strand:- start:905 stop:1072 length:168 start_codon:yes stop_codon:yes gene_type:complete